MVHSSPSFLVALPAVACAQTLSVTPDVLNNSLTVVTVSWSNNNDAGEFDWIAAYSPIPDTLDDYRNQLPVKYFNFTTGAPAAQGSINMTLLHMRANWTFAYVKGGYDSPTIVALSNVVSYEPWLDYYPMQLHLTRTTNHSEMAVVWTAGLASVPLVQYSTSVEALLSSELPTLEVVQSVAVSSQWFEHLGYGIARANTTTYTRDQMCEGLAKGAGWRDPGAINRALVGIPTPNHKYFYRVFDLMYGGIPSDVYSFYSPPLPSSDIDFIIFGDFGQATLDGTIGWAEWVQVNGSQYEDIDQPPVVNTSISIVRDMNDGSIDNSTALVFIIGDISYARGREALWDQFHYLLQPIAASLPVMTCIGNHELDYSRSYWPGEDSNGECGVPLMMRFPMPSPPSSYMTRKNAGIPGEGFTDTPWYSFDHGSVHFLLMSTEHAFDSNSEQFQFLANDLKQVNRVNTPWIVMSSHRPMYVSSTSMKKNDSDMAVAALLRQYVEPLLQEFEVDVYFAGHHHDFQRTCAVNNQTCVPGTGVSIYQAEDQGVDESNVESTNTTVDAPTFGTVHVVTGASGQWCNTYLSPTQFPWLTYANEMTHGYTRARARGNKFTIELVSSADRTILDSTTIVKGNKAKGIRTKVIRNKSASYAGERAIKENDKDEQDESRDDYVAEY